MVAISLFLAAVFTALGAAWPEPTPAVQLDLRAVDCSKATGALRFLKKLGPPATSFCSSYHNIAGTMTVDDDIHSSDCVLLAAFAAAKVSEGCSCLNLQPKATTTNTRTAVAPMRLLTADFGQIHMC
ncbi:hypothetical protein SVAN01_11336 [Stagonosporopsis vannaccii]|nr:hypothetical protein SVAN01_11336 [Stagonosporopsis vannaccii]